MHPTRSTPALVVVRVAMMLDLEWSTIFEKEPPCRNRQGERSRAVKVTSRQVGIPEHFGRRARASRSAYDARIEPEEYRRTSHETWKAMALGWERWRVQLEEALFPVRVWLLGQLAPRPGDTVLELSAGAGDTGFAAAAIIGERGRLISTDFSPDMVEVARRRGAELKLRNVDYRAMDAERIELDADSVDGVLCQSGYMLMADPAAALLESRRVLRPGGRLALSVWGAPEGNPWASTGGRILIECAQMPPPEPGAPGIFSIASEAQMHALLADAGFAATRTDKIPVRFAFRDIDEYERWVMDVGGPFAVVVRGLPRREREELRSRLSEEFAPFAAGGRLRAPRSRTRCGSKLSRSAPLPDRLVTARPIGRRSHRPRFRACPRSGRGGWHATGAARQGRRERPDETYGRDRGRGLVVRDACQVP